MGELYKYIDTKGVILPDSEDVKKEVQDKFKEALGNDLCLQDATPQGRLIDIITQSRTEVLNICAAIANVINPNTSYGCFLDSICALTGCVRRKASRSSVIAKLGGSAGTVVPANVQAVTTNGDIFYLENETTIGEDGTAEALFLSLEAGEIPCSAGSLTVVNTTVLGWETVTNEAPATLGKNEESDTELKLRRLETLYNGRGFIGDIQSRLSNVENIKSYVVRQNNKNHDVTLNNILLKPHSVYVCAHGGSDLDIAKALYKSVPAGCDYTGNVKINVQDEYNFQEYEVAFDRPSIIPIDVKIYLKKDTGTGDVTEAVRQAVVDYENGLVENVNGLSIGVNVSPFEIASAINIQVAGVFVSQVQIAKHGLPLSVESISININEIAHISEENITIRVAE